MLAAFLYSQFAGPWYEAMRMKQEHIDTLHEAFRRGEELQVRRDELLAEFNTIDPGLVRTMHDAVPEHSPENVVQFFIALNRMIQLSGLPYDTAYSIGAERVDSGVATVIPVTFSFSGINYGVLRSFIGRLRQWSRGVRVVSVQISAAVDDVGGRTDSVDAVVVIEPLFSEVITGI